MLGRLARCGYGVTVVHHRAQKAISWLTSNEPSSDSQLPGLHFEEAGVAVPIAEAISGSLIDQNEVLYSFLPKALSDELTGLTLPLARYLLGAPPCKRNPDFLLRQSQT